MLERLFSYGTLQRDDVQMALFGRLLKGAPDALIGFRQQLVVITDPDVLAKSEISHHPIVVPGCEDDQVPGTVIQITAEELAALDRYEVSDYKRVSASLASRLTTRVYMKA
jgi:gamma-glutamylcyclotransferase (GGCT)/AIG2-like uncharacterized protein YtfP